MDQFVVPQFIEVEDKIFGPVTTRQFIIMLASGLFLFIAYKLADFALFIFLLALIGGSTLIIAFVKINGQPFHYFILNIIQTIRRPSRRIWRRERSKEELNLSRQGVKIDLPESVQRKRPLSYNRLRDLSLVVNTGGYYKPD
ncbi:MAG: PrgI family protein [bacterium]